MYVKFKKNVRVTEASMNIVKRSLQYLEDLCLHEGVRLETLRLLHCHLEAVVVAEDSSALTNTIEQ